MAHPPGGHALLIGVPGLAKTKLVDTLGTVLGSIRPAASSSRRT
jgi:MoxR-like ATPase